LNAKDLQEKAANAFNVGCGANKFLAVLGLAIVWQKQKSHPAGNFKTHNRSA
jgi:hypothetical protein